VLRKIVFFSATAALAAAGFVGGSMAAIGGGRACPPGSPCAPGTSTQSGSATTGVTGTTSTTSTGSTVKGPKPTLKLSASAIDFGATLTLTGKVPGAPAGQVVEILSQSCGFNQVLAIGKTKTRGDGSYVFAIQPMQNVIFYARSANTASDPQTVNIRPKIELRHGAGRNFAVNVSAGGGSFFSTSVTLERYDNARRLWRPVAAGKLRPNSDPAEIIAVSSATIRVKIASGVKLRASVSQVAVGQCFRPAKSPPITA
jgi:hypothetical protein